MLRDRDVEWSAFIDNLIVQGAKHVKKFLLVLGHHGLSDIVGVYRESFALVFYDNEGSVWVNNISAKETANHRHASAAAKLSLVLDLYMILMGYYFSVSLQKASRQERLARVFK